MGCEGGKEGVVVEGSSYKRRKNIHFYGYCLEGLFYSSFAVIGRAIVLRTFIDCFLYLHDFLNKSGAPIE